MHNEQQNGSSPTSALHALVAWVAALGTCLVLVMATLAFGPSGFAFAAVIAVAGFLLMLKRYRFSLKGFLIASTAFGVWLGLKVSKDLKTERAIAGIASAGGNLEVHERYPNFPWGFWAERYNVHFYGLARRLTNEQVAYLQLLPPSSLRWLNLENTGISDDHVPVVSRFHHLEYLSLANQTYLDGGRMTGPPQNRITDAALAELRPLRSLMGLDLSGTDVTDDCVAYLLEMPDLRWIYLSGSSVTGAGMAELSRLKNLHTLQLNGCPISADGYREIGQLRNVGSLALSDTSMTDADLDALHNMWQLSNLLIRSKHISDEALQRFQNDHPSCRIQRFQH